MEQAISGYRPDVELELTKREQEIRDMLLLVKPHEKAAPPKRLLPSGIDCVLWFECPVEECLRRADGRRVVPQNEPIDKIYHVEDVPPPINEAPLCEMLEPFSQDQDCVASVVDRCLSFNQQTNSLKRWLSIFGEESKNRTLLQTIQGFQQKDRVQIDVQRVLNEIVEGKKHNSLVMREVIAYKLREKFQKLLAEQQAEMERRAQEEAEAELAAEQEVAEIE